MAVSVTVIRPSESSSTAPGQARVVEVVRGTSSPIETVVGTATVSVVQSGGTVANAQWGYGLPSSPYEGMIWIDVT